MLKEYIASHIYIVNNGVNLRSTYTAFLNSFLKNIIPLYVDLSYSKYFLAWIMGRPTYPLNRLTEYADRLEADDLHSLVLDSMNKHYERNSRHNVNILGGNCTHCVWSRRPSGFLPSSGPRGRISLNFCTNNPEIRWLITKNVKHSESKLVQYPLLNDSKLSTIDIRVDLDQIKN